MSKPTVPNTITDHQHAELSRRAQRAAPSLFDPKAIRQRKASSAQQRKADQS